MWWKTVVALATICIACSVAVVDMGSSPSTTQAFRQTNFPVPPVFTVEVWLMVPPQGISQHPFGFCKLGGPDNELLLVVTDSYCYFAITASTIGSSGGCGADGAWHHVALTYNASFTAVMYVDGVPGPTGTKSRVVGPSTTFVVGNDQDGGACSITDPNQHFAGYLSEFRVWNRVLSPAEIVAASQGPVVDPHLRSDLHTYFPFNADDFTPEGNLIDRSPNAFVIGNNGVAPAFAPTVTLPPDRFVTPPPAALVLSGTFPSVTLAPAPVPSPHAIAVSLWLKCAASSSTTLLRLTTASGITVDIAANGAGAISATASGSATAPPAPHAPAYTVCDGTSWRFVGLQLSTAGPTTRFELFTSASPPASSSVHTTMFVAPTGPTSLGATYSVLLGGTTAVARLTTHARRLASAAAIASAASICHAHASPLTVAAYHALNTAVAPAGLTYDPSVTTTPSTPAFTLCPVLVGHDPLTGITLYAAAPSAWSLSRSIALPAFATAAAAALATPTSPAHAVALASAAASLLTSSPAVNTTSALLHVGLAGTDGVWRGVTGLYDGVRAPHVGLPPPHSSAPTFAHLNVSSPGAWTSDNRTWTPLEATTQPTLLIALVASTSCAAAGCAPSYTCCPSSLCAPSNPADTFSGGCATPTAQWVDAVGHTYATLGPLAATRRLHVADATAASAASYPAQIATLAELAAVTTAAPLAGQAATGLVATVAWSGDGQSVAVTDVAFGLSGPHAHGVVWRAAAGPLAQTASLLNTTAMVAQLYADVWDPDAAPSEYAVALDGSLITSTAAAVLVELGSCTNASECTAAHGANRTLCAPSGACECSIGRTGSMCDVPCCSGAGTCSYASSTCTSCLPLVAGTQCGVACPVSCGHGVCDDGVGGSGLCVCDAGWGGPACDTAPPPPPSPSPSPPPPAAAPVAPAAKTSMLEDVMGGSTASQPTVVAAMWLVVALLAVALWSAVKRGKNAQTLAHGDVVVISLAQRIQLDHPVAGIFAAQRGDAYSAAARIGALAIHLNGLLLGAWLSVVVGQPEVEFDSIGATVSVYILAAVVGGTLGVVLGEPLVPLVAQYSSRAGVVLGALLGLLWTCVNAALLCTPIVDVEGRGAVAITTCISFAISAVVSWLAARPLFSVWRYHGVLLKFVRPAGSELGKQKRKVAPGEHAGSDHSASRPGSGSDSDSGGAAGVEDDDDVRPGTWALDVSSDSDSPAVEMVDVSVRDHPPSKRTRRPPRRGASVR